MAGITAARLNEIGGRQNNEDAIYPGNEMEVHPHHRLFIVCDGVGGQQKGEIASKLLTRHFAFYFESGADSLEAALRHAEAEMNRSLEHKPETRGMASTLTAIFFDDFHRTARIGWVGDSRVYHIRDGRVLFKTKDHSEVQSLIDMGEITEEESLIHPKRNIITRAINGTSPARMDQQQINDIALGDYFLLCTDGLLETLQERRFPDIFKKENGVAGIREILFKQAQGHTKDNFSMYLLQVHPTEEDLDQSEAARHQNKSRIKPNQFAHRFFGNKKP